LPRDTDGLAAFLGGFVAAEGSFGMNCADGRFRFAIGLAAADRQTCGTFRAFMQVGRLYSSPRRKPHYDDECSFVVQSLRDLVTVVVPFMDAHLPESYKREQYLAWRARLLEYWEHNARRRGRRPCTVDGCDTPARAHGYCRHHLWEHRRQ